MPRRPEPALHLEEAPATPAQWKAWCWLWRKLLVQPPPPTAPPRDADAAEEAEHPDT